MTKVTERNHGRTSTADRPGLFSKLGKMFVRDEAATEEEFETPASSDNRYRLSSAHRYSVTIRRGISTFDDAMEAAQGLKRGDQQILNLMNTETALRQKIVDFMSGVNFAQGGTWEEIGQDIYLIVPANAYVEVAPCSPRLTSNR